MKQYVNKLIGVKLASSEVMDFLNLTPCVRFVVRRKSNVFGEIYFINQKGKLIRIISGDVDDEVSKLPDGVYEAFAPSKLLICLLQDKKHVRSVGGLRPL